MILDPPLFPERELVDGRARAEAEATILGGSAGSYRVQGTIAALTHWVRGNTFHRYGVSAFDELVADGLTIAEALKQMHDRPARLDLRGELRAGFGWGMSWTLSYARVGLPDSFGLCSGYSRPEDAAYNALSAIEREERERFVETLVVGVA